MATTQEGSYFSVETALGADALLLRSFHGEEALSSLFSFRLEMASETADLDFEAIVGQSATITVQLSDGSERYINGIIGRFVQAGKDAGFTYYYADLHPWLWLMTMSADCKIFQQQATPDILAAMFSELGFADYEDRLTGSYAEREFCVQYNETAFDFVSRLMQEEGIHYFFEHQDGKHTLVLADDASVWQDCPAAATVRYGTADIWHQQNVVTRCLLEQRVIAGKYAVDDFNFETPSTDLMASVDSTAALDGSERRIYEYPGGLLKKDALEGRAKLGIERVETPQKMLRGDSATPDFTSGYKFTLTDHYRADANSSYVLSRVVHSAEEKSYRNSFEALPAAVDFRPPRTTPKPVIAGTQTAIVVGKSGEEIWPDKYGRVKVQFHWDQLGANDENSSCWIRVSQAWAGKSYGRLFLPRIGQEVIVSFLEGDPDRPLVTGAVYNAEQTVPYTLPDEKTKSTVKTNSSLGGGGFNELRFEDKKDSEEVYFQAERDFNRVVKNNDTLKVGFETMEAGDQTIDVYNDRTATLEEGSESLTVKKGDRTIKVETGKETHEVADTRTVTVTKEETHNNSDNFTQNVDQDYTLKVAGDLLIDVTGEVTIKAGGALTIESGGEMTQDAGSSLLAKAGTTLTNKSGTSLSNEAGTDLSNKAGTNLTNEASISMTNKASASQTVDGGGMLTLKGGLVKIN